MLGLPIALAALSGFPLAFWEETDAIFDPVFYPAWGAGDQPIAAQAVLAAAHADVKDAELHGIYFPRDTAAAHVGFGLPDGRHAEVAVDLRTGSVIGKRSFDETVIGMLYTFHTDFMMGPIGRWIMVFCAAGLLFLALSGIMRMWPRPFDLRRFMPTKRNLLSLWHLHNLLGFWAMVPLTVVSITTIGLFLLPSTPQESSRETSPISNGGIDAMAARTLAASPGSTLRGISGLSPTAPDIRIIVEDRWGFVWEQRFERDSPEPKASTQRSAANELRAWHSGTIVGHMGRVAMGMVGVIPTILIITGLLVLARKQGRKHPLN